MKKEPLFISFSNQKGGVGKSAFTVLMASYFNYVLKKNVAIIDCDSPQHSINEDRERIRRLKNTIINLKEVYTYIGLLTALRVAHDSSDETLSGRIENYPLNQSQISAFTEDILIRMKGRDTISAWDLYNIATEYYKPEKTSIPSLIHQNIAFASTLNNFCQFRENEIMDVEAVLVS